MLSVAQAQLPTFVPALPGMTASLYAVIMVCTVALFGMQLLQVAWRKWDERKKERRDRIVQGHIASMLKNTNDQILGAMDDNTKETIEAKNAALAAKDAGVNATHAVNGRFEALVGNYNSLATDVRQLKDGFGELKKTVSVLGTSVELMATKRNYGIRYLIENKIIKGEEDFETALRKYADLDQEAKDKLAADVEAGKAIIT